MNALLPRRARGFTLVEVLVALAVVAITLSAGIKAAGGLTVNAQRMTDLTVAKWCAENHLTALRLTRSYPSVGDSDFTCQQMGRELPGRMVVRPTPKRPITPPNPSPSWCRFPRGVVWIPWPVCWPTSCARV